MDAKRWKYDVCLSFASEQRGYVDQVARAMADSQVRVFYDKFAVEDMWGRDLSIYFEGIYHSLSSYCMIFASREYVTKSWPSFERAHAIARQIEDRGDYILPVTMDGTKVPGLATTVRYEDGREKSPREIAKAFVRRLHQGKRLDEAARRPAAARGAAGRP